MSGMNYFVFQQNSSLFCSESTKGCSSVIPQLVLSMLINMGVLQMLFTIDPWMKYSVIHGTMIHLLRFVFILLSNLLSRSWPVLVKHGHISFKVGQEENKGNVIVKEKFSGASHSPPPHPRHAKGGGRRFTKHLLGGAYN